VSDNTVSCGRYRALILGFARLSRWSEGEKIGLEGRGIDAPITAVMKKSKLGLGATR